MFTNVPYTFPALQAKARLFFLLALLVAVPLAAQFWSGTRSVGATSPAAAGPAATPTPPAPVVTVNAPSNVFIGEPFKFTVTFDNANNAGVGFAPYVSVVLPGGGIGLNAGGEKCDGITRDPASSPLMIKVNGGPLPLKFYETLTSPCPTPNPGPGPIVTHPPGGPLPPVDVPLGGQLLTIELPFGSFEPDQEPVTVEITAVLSDYADINKPLTIYATGGFLLGADELSNPSTDPPVRADGGNPSNAAAWAASATVTPKLITFAKASTAPENEAVSGPNFVSYYPLRYLLDVDIAQGQTIDKLVVTDKLPPNVQYAGSLQVKIKGSNAIATSSCPPTSGPLNVAVSLPTTNPGGTLTVKLCRPITGALGPGDVTVTFAFYIPEKYANGQDILAKDCSNSPVQVINDGRVTGTWTPLDPRDSSAVPVIEDVTPQDHILFAKCLAIQKPVPKIIKEHPGGGAGYTPGDVLVYELPFQVSDYRTIGKIMVRDFLSDGQLFLPGTVKLTVTDQFGTKSGTMPPATVNVASYQPNLKNCLASPAGSTVLTFNVSLAMASLPQSARPRLTAGVVTGGHAAGLPLSPVPANGKISFHVQIMDAYKSLSGPDRFVDKHDKLSNCVNISGSVFQNVNKPIPINAPTNLPNAVIGATQDGSATSFVIVPDKFSKSVYAVRRGGGFLCGGTNAPPCSNFPHPPQEVRPGDHVTYLIEKVIPSSDAEALVIRDWLPLPVFNVAPMTFSPTPCVGIPAAGTSCLGPTDTLSAAVNPVFSFDPTTNSIQFNYGTINDPNSQQKTIALLFTSTVTNKPFADGLFLSNDAVECEKHTFNPTAICERAVARINLREPKLVIRKGIIAADNPNAVFTHPASPQTQPVATATPPPGVTFGLNGLNVGSNGMTGVVNSTHLASFQYFDSDITGGVDANDTVTFAIVIENLGWAPAYDVKLEDLIPLVGGNPCYTLDLNSLKVTRGSGLSVLPVLYTLTSSAASGPGFTIASNPFLSIPIADYNATNGSNIVIITVKAKLRADITPGCCRNVATLTNYASQPGGPNFVSAGLSPKPVDTAEVCVLPTAEKCISATSEPHTQPDSSTPAGPVVPLTVGEIVTFHLQVTLPEGSTPFFRIRDNLPAGLTYIPGTAKLSLISDNGIISSIPGLASAKVTGSKAGCKYRPQFPLPPSQVSSVPPSTPFAPGVDPEFYLGTLTNSDNNDSDLEYVVVEFNALVSNIPANVNNTTWSNNYDVLFGKQYTKLATSNNSDVMVVEPNVGVQKSIGSVNATGHTPFTIKLTNTGGAAAFDVRMDDTMPNMLTLWGGSPVPTVTAAPSGCVSPLPTAGLDLTGNTIGLSIPKLPQGCSVAVTFYVRVGTNCFTNTAKVFYSTLPGGLLNLPIGTQNNGTGSVTPCKSNNGDDCERLYNTTGQASVTTGCTSAACAKPPPHMVSWWPLNETSGNTVADIKGGHTGTTSNAIGAGPNPASLPKVGGALFFGSANAAVPGSPYDFGKGSFSIDAWVRATPLSSAVSGIVDKLDTSSTPPTGYSFFVRNVSGSGKLQLIMDSATFTSSGAVAYGTWQHVAVTVQRVAGGAMVGTFYINGGYAGTFTPPSVDVSSKAALLLGSHRLNVGCQSCEVALDEVEIFDDVVSPAMIKAIYAAGPAGKCTSGLNGVSPARPVPLSGFSPTSRPD